MTAQDNRLRDDDAPRDTIDAPSLLVDFSTDRFEQSKRFEGFCDFFMDRVLAFDEAENLSDNFAAEMKSTSFGMVGVSKSACTPGRWARKRPGREAESQSILLRVLHSGRARGNVAGRQFDLTPGMVSVVPLAAPSELLGLETYQSTCLTIPRDMVETLLRPGQMIEPMLIDYDDQVMAMAFTYATASFHRLGTISNDVAQLVGQHIADLVALSLGANQDARDQISERGLKAVRIDTILQAIAKSFASPLVSPATIGAQMGISERHVHRLLEETNRTFYEHLLEARLSNAHRMLSDLHSAGQTIAEIAEAAGFSNVTYFNRMFRQRFGDTPSGVRVG